MARQGHRTLSPCPLRLSGLNLSDACSGDSVTAAWDGQDETRAITLWRLHT